MWKFSKLKGIFHKNKFIYFFINHFLLLNIKSVPAWRCLLENARERKLYHEISENCIEDIQKYVIDKIKLKKSNSIV